MTEKECEYLNSIMNRIKNLTVDEKENIFHRRHFQQPIPPEEFNKCKICDGTGLNVLGTACRKCQGTGVYDDVCNRRRK